MTPSEPATAPIHPAPISIAKLQRVELREVWKHEALDFTRWLQENLDVLNDILDLTLSSAEREQPAGNFNVDLVAEDDAGNPVIIENQLEKSNHDHLGKIITYLTAIEAKTAIWIVSDPRPEHVAAIAWLNDSSPARFYLLKVEAIRIGDSPAAPLLTLIVGPSEGSPSVAHTKRDLAERFDIRHRFWTQLLDKAKVKTNLLASRSPGQYSWIGTGAGKRGITLNLTIRQHEAAAELYIDRGKDSEQENKAIFDQLQASKGSIEAAFGGPLDWQRLNGKRACRIKHDINLGGYRDETNWPAIHDHLIDAVIRLDKALSPQIKNLQI